MNTHQQQRYQLWRPSKEQNDRNKNIDNDSDNDSSSHLKDEVEFHRIRNMRRLDEILKPRERPSAETSPNGIICDSNSDVVSEDNIPQIITKRTQTSLITIMNSSLVVGQEVALTVILLSVHREIVVHEETGLDFMANKGVNKFDMAMWLVYGTMVVIVYYNLHSYSTQLMGTAINGEDSSGESVEKNAGSNAFETINSSDADESVDSKYIHHHHQHHHAKEHRRKKAIVRLSDALLLAAMLRFISGVLRTLTASYSTDTVYALAISGMVIHLLACDYRYANGHACDKEGKNPFSATSHPRPAFLGGTVSLNAAFFSTALLVSRIKSNATSYAYVLSVVTLFAFYPASRHSIARRYPNTLGEFEYYYLLMSNQPATFFSRSHECNKMKSQHFISGVALLHNYFCAITLRMVTFISIRETSLWFCSIYDFGYISMHSMAASKTQTIYNRSLGYSSYHSNEEIVDTLACRLSILSND